MSLLRYLTIVVTISLISGCGWKLSQPQSLPANLRIVYLDSNLSSDFRQSLVAELSARGSIITSTRDDAQIRLEQTHFQVEQQELTIDSSGKTAEYELLATACMDIKKTDQPTQNRCSSARARLSNDTSRVLATQFETNNRRALLLSELSRILINQIIAQGTHP